MNFHWIVYYTKIYIKDCTYIFMFHMFQHLELSVCSLCMNLWLKRSSYFLDGHFDSNAFCWESLCVSGGANLMVNIDKSINSISVLTLGIYLTKGPCPNRHQVLVPIGHLPHCVNQLHSVETLLYCHSDLSVILFYHIGCWMVSSHNNTIIKCYDIFYEPILWGPRTRVHKAQGQ